MSEPVTKEKIPSVIGDYGPSAYLLTVSDDQSVHLASVYVVMADGRPKVSVGRRSGANATARPSVTLLWAVREPGGMSFIVDGRAIVEGSSVEIEPTSGMLHRTAGPPDQA